MAATTRWKDTQATSIEECIQKMTSVIPDDDSTNTVYWRNFRSSVVDDIDSTVEINGQDIEFAVVKYSYDKVSRNDPDNIVRKSGQVIVYEKNGTIYHIIDSKSIAKKLIRKMLGYSGRNEIEEAGFNCTEDFFVWVVNRVYNTEGTIENNSEDAKVLELEEIKGIRGRTEDLQTRVSAKGESVMNVISTLSFLLESRRLNQVIINMKYTNHDNLVVMLQNGKVEVQNPYLGEFDSEPIQSQYAKLYILLYNEILPLMEETYSLDIEENIWNQDEYVNFLQNVKDVIINKINQKIDSVTAIHNL